MQIHYEDCRKAVNPSSVLKDLAEHDSVSSLFWAYLNRKTHGINCRMDVTKTMMTNLSARYDGKTRYIIKDNQVMADAAGIMDEIANLPDHLTTIPAEGMTVYINGLSNGLHIVLS